MSDVGRQVHDYEDRAMIQSNITMFKEAADLFRTNTEPNKEESTIEKQNETFLQQRGQDRSRSSTAGGDFLCRSLLESRLQDEPSFQYAGSNLEKELIGLLNAHKCLDNVVVTD